MDLPQGKAEPLPADSKPPVVASINAEGEYFLDLGGSPNNEVLDLEEISTRVSAIIKMEPDRPVVVKGDRAIPYERVIQLMVSLQNAGVPSVGLMTDSPEEK